MEQCKRCNENPRIIDDLCPGCFLADERSFTEEPDAKDHVRGGSGAVAQGQDD